MARSGPRALEPGGHDRRDRADAEGGMEAALRLELGEVGRELSEAALAHGRPRARVAGPGGGRPRVAGLAGVGARVRGEGEGEGEGER